MVRNLNREIRSRCEERGNVKMGGMTGVTHSRVLSSLPAVLAPPFARFKWHPPSIRSVGVGIESRMRRSGLWRVGVICTASVFVCLCRTSRSGAFACGTEGRDTDDGNDNDDDVDGYFLSVGFCWWRAVV
ncbi:unnamed protein product [Taenia asiatica]|uniref:Transmembrane protein n=1 Tax=Taenia asiatica TaxID=60517 RepID=A0A0R3W076_TAEAS|nr:unnamed protein product [Taenia asiatica]